MSHTLLHKSTFSAGNLKATRVLLNFGIEHVNLTRVIIHVLQSFYRHLKVTLPQQRPGGEYFGTFLGSIQPTKNYKLDLSTK